MNRNRRRSAEDHSTRRVIQFGGRTGELTTLLLTPAASLGVAAWFEEAELRIGDSLRREIDQGARAQCLRRRDLFSGPLRQGLAAVRTVRAGECSVAGEQNLPPIWHKVSKDEVKAQSPSLAGKVARSTAEFIPAEIAEEIARRLRPNLFDKDE